MVHLVCEANRARLEYEVNQAREESSSEVAQGSEAGAGAVVHLDVQERLAQQNVVDEAVRA